MIVVCDWNEATWCSLATAAAETDRLSNDVMFLRLAITSQSRRTNLAISIRITGDASIRDFNFAMMLTKHRDIDKTSIFQT